MTNLKFVLFKGNLFQLAQELTGQSVSYIEHSLTKFFCYSKPSSVLRAYQHQGTAIHHDGSTSRWCTTKNIKPIYTKHAKIRHQKNMEKAVSTSVHVHNTWYEQIEREQLHESPKTRTGSGVRSECVSDCQAGVIHLCTDVYPCKKRFSWINAPLKNRVPHSSKINLVSSASQTEQEVTPRPKVKTKKSISTGSDNPDSLWSEYLIQLGTALKYDLPLPSKPTPRSTSSDVLERLMNGESVGKVNFSRVVAQKVKQLSDAIEYIVDTLRHHEVGKEITQMYVLGYIRGITRFCVGEERSRR